MAVEISGVTGYTESGEMPAFPLNYEGSGGKIAFPRVQRFVVFQCGVNV
jgi:hypothetical protein